jgi:hypothetical protein
MEYFLGSIITLSMIYVLNKIYARKTSNMVNHKMVYRQSHIFDTVKVGFLIETLIDKSKKDLLNTQSTNHHDSLFVRIIFLDNNAYWIKDNTFYTAKMIDNKIDSDSTEIVDMMAIDKVQLEKMIFIVDKLNEGINDDRSNPR